MNLGISKKLIFFSFLFTNFIQPIKSADLQKTNKIDENHFFHQSDLFNWNDKQSSLLLNYNSNKLPLEKNNVEKNSGVFLSATIENQKELIIQSDKQSVINNVLFA